MNLDLLVRRHLWSAPPRSPAEAVAFSKQAHIRCTQAVRLFYAVGIYWMIDSMLRWPALIDSEVIDPQWPAEWIDAVGVGAGITAIVAIYAMATVVVAAVPWSRLARVAYTLSLLQFMAVDNGFGKIGHGVHTWLWVSAFFILLPRGRAAWRADAQPDGREAFADVVRLAQLCVLFFYTLTGLWKVFYAVTALFSSQVSGFTINGFSYLIAENLLRTGRDTLVGETLVANPVLGWLLFLGTMYLEAASIVIVFRPRLHRLWGLGLILFHLGTMAAMEVFFPSNIALLGILFVASPFVPDQVDWRTAVRDLPGVHLMGTVWDRLRTGRPEIAPGPAR